MTLELKTSLAALINSLKESLIKIKLLVYIQKMFVKTKPPLLSERLLWLSNWSKGGADSLVNAGTELIGDDGIRLSRPHCHVGLPAVLVPHMDGVAVGQLTHSLVTARHVEVQPPLSPGYRVEGVWREHGEPLTALRRHFPHLQASKVQSTVGNNGSSFGEILIKYLFLDIKTSYHVNELY